MITFDTLLNKYKDKSANAIILSKDPSIIQFRNLLISRTNFLPDNTHLKLRIYCIIHNISSMVICNNCDNPTTIDNNRGIFRKFCSTTCQHESRVIKLPDYVNRKWLIDEHHAKKKSLSRISQELGLEPHHYRKVLSLLKAHDIQFIDWKNKIQFIDELHSKEWLTEHYINRHKSMDDIADELGVSGSTVQIQINKFGLDISPANSYDRKFVKRSKGEIALSEFLAGYTIVENSNRSLIESGEIDIYLPDHNIGIEYNGIYYHSQYSGNKDRKYHITKTNDCLSNNIQLLHIWDVEWNEKQEIVKSLILSKINKSNKLYARKCAIKEIDVYTKNDFLDNNHIQGTDSSSIKLGLYHNDELVSVMTFGKTRFTGKSDIPWELVRFCNKLNISVVGGASKLLKHFTRLYNGNIVSYADKRISNGGLYKTLGFELYRNNNESYKYTKDYKLLESRYKYTKGNLKLKFPELWEEDKSESMIMLEAGYDVVWDCGTLTYHYIN